MVHGTMNGADFVAVVNFMGFETAMMLHQMDEHSKQQARRRAFPRLRRENGGWVCVRAHTGVGWGLTPAAAYHDWREKLTRDEE